MRAPVVKQIIAGDRVAATRHAKCCRRTSRKISIFFGTCRCASGRQPDIGRPELARRRQAQTRKFGHNRVRAATLDGHLIDFGTGECVDVAMRVVGKHAVHTHRCASTVIVHEPAPAPVQWWSSRAVPAENVRTTIPWSLVRYSGMHTKYSSTENALASKMPCMFHADALVRP